MPATAQIQIEVDDSGAIQTFHQISAEGAKIGPSLEPVAPALDKMTSSTKKSREAAALLSEEFAIKIPRGLRNVVAESSAVGPAVALAFNALAVGAFIQVVRTAANSLTGFSVELAAINKQSNDIIASTAQANKILTGPKNLQQVNADILQTTQRMEKLNEVLSLTGSAPVDALLRGLSKYTSLGRGVVDALDQAKAKLNDLTLEQAKLIDQQRRGDVLEVLKAQNTAREAGLKGIAAISQAEKDQVRVVKEQIAQNVTDEKVGQAQIVAIHADAAAKKKLFQEQYIEFTRNLAGQGAHAELQAEASGLHGRAQIEASFLAQLQQITMQETQATLALKRQGINEEIVLYGQRNAAIKTKDDQLKQIDIANADAIYQAQSAAALASVPPWARAYAQIQADYAATIRKIQQDRAFDLINDREAAQLSAAAWQTAFAHTRDQLAGDLQSLFDDITSGNIGQRFKKMFEDLVFQMVATWILGMNSMRAAASGGFGGGSTGILGALLGIGGGGALGGGQSGISGLPGVITNWGNGGSSTSFGGGIGALPVGIPGLGISAGIGNVPGVVLPSGSSTGGAVSGLAGLLTKIFPHGLNIGGLSISGSALAAGGLALAFNGIGRGGVLGTLEGAAGGALTGFAIGGPIGAVIGGIVGALASFIGGLFGPHKGDTARIQVMEPLFAAIKQVTDSYDVFQTDYNTGVSELETLRTNSLAALKKIGGRQVSGNSAETNRRVDAAEQHLKDTEAERQRRAQLSFGPPQFHEGGLVRGGAAAILGRPEFHYGGEVNANLLVGEGVVNQRGMSLLGEAGLNRLNAGGGAGTTHFHITVNAIDAKSFDGWATGGGTKMIVKALRRASMEGMI